MGTKDTEVAQARLAAKRAECVEYLRKRRIYRGDIGCNHRYTPHDPADMHDTAVEVTVCRTIAHVTVTHALRG